MTEAPAGPDLRRILVALEDEEAGAVIETAARLAAAMHAELVGLFVEDTELLEAANLPITSSVPRHGAGRARLDADVMRRALRVSAHQASRRLAVVAERSRVKWSFRVIRGAATEQVLAEAESHDLLALTGPGRALGGGRRQAAAQALAERAPCSVLLMRGAVRAGQQPVVAVYDGSERALAFGRDLARAYARPLIVLAVAEDAEAATRRGEQAAAWLAAHEVKAGALALALGTADELCQAVGGRNPAMLVLDRQGALAAKLDFESLLRGLGCPLFALR
jgi:hypothetical protein